VKYPALDVDALDADFLLALVDEFGPSAVEIRGSLVTIFFTEAAGRDRARDVVVRAYPEATVSARDVDDEDWARRSQDNLEPVTVGRITVVPSWHAASALTADPRARAPAPDPVTIVITPSMGFGTGHHATTR